MKKVKVGIIGHTGRLGRPLLEIIKKHPCAELIYTESPSAGQEGSDQDGEIFFLALPHGKSAKYVKRYEGKKIIDLSLDHRHNFGWAYGLPEAFGRKIAKSVKIANPGCYATSIILGLLPLAKMIRSAHISSTSGISGAGKGVSLGDNFLIYKQGKKHPQMREIKRVLRTTDILFVPQRIDTADRGIVSTIFVETNFSSNIAGMFADFYRQKPFVRIVERKNIETKNVIRANFCDIKVEQYGREVLVISALDNIVKGGAGQAVQNFNLMCGFPETTGLI